jgi:hypothetical protein
MPSYEICYLDDDDSLVFTFTAICADDTRAKVLAHAMKLNVHKKFEVWNGKTLVYGRPYDLSGDVPNLSPPQQPFSEHAA